MGLLVRTAQSVEDRVQLARQQVEPKLRGTMQEARVEWLELKGRTRGPVGGSELRLRAFLLRADARLRMWVDQSIGKTIVELERMRRRITRTP